MKIIYEVCHKTLSIFFDEIDLAKNFCSGFTPADGLYIRERSVFEKKDIVSDENKNENKNQESFSF